MPPSSVLLICATLGQVVQGGAASWAVYRSSAGGFTVAMPGSISEQKITKEQDGQPIETIVVASAQDNVSFKALRIQNAGVLSNKAEEDQFFQVVVQGTVKNLKGNLRKVEEIRVGRYPGREMVVDFQQEGGGRVVTRMRYILAGPFTFHQAVTGPAVPDEDAARFFKSLQISSIALRVRPGMTTRPGRVITRPEPPPERVFWRTVSSKDGGFRAQFPAKPTEQQEPGILSAQTNYIFTAQVEGAVYSVQYQDLSASEVRKSTVIAMNSARNKIVEQSGGSLSGEKPIKFRAGPAREFRIDPLVEGGPQAAVRIYLVGRRLFQVIVLAPKSNFPTLNTEKFFDSFALLTKR